MSRRPKSGRRPAANIPRADPDRSAGSTSACRASRRSWSHGSPPTATPAPNGLAGIGKSVTGPKFQVSYSPVLLGGGSWTHATSDRSVTTSTTTTWPVHVAKPITRMRKHRDRAPSSRPPTTDSRSQARPNSRTCGWRWGSRTVRWPITAECLRRRPAGRSLGMSGARGGRRQRQQRGSASSFTTWPGPSRTTERLLSR